MCADVGGWLLGCVFWVSWVAVGSVGQVSESGLSFVWIGLSDTFARCQDMAETLQGALALSLVPL